MPRPQLKPTQEQRHLVRSMAGMGIPHGEIARKIGVRSPKTLRKHFRHELDLGATEANYKVAQTLFQMATSGKSPAATIFWAKTRNRFKERPADDVRHVAPPPFIVAREQGDQRHDHA
jgi:replication-associated recombination protein RarA